MKIRIPVRPVLKEHVTLQDGSRFRVHWFCEPPEVSEVFSVTRQEWRRNLRKIYAWEPVGANVIECDGFTLRVVRWGSLTWV